MFDIVTIWDQDNLGNMTRDDVLSYIDSFQMQQKAAIADLVMEGELNFEDYTLRNDSFQTARWGTEACAPSMIKDGNKCSEFSLSTDF